MTVVAVLATIDPSPAAIALIAPAAAYAIFRNREVIA